MQIKPCFFCGQLPKIERISKHWFNATHETCNDQPGVSIANNPSADHAIIAWNKWQEKMKKEFPKDTQPALF